MLHGFDKDDIVEYVPECERGAEEPCIIRLKFVPFSQVQKYAKMLAARTKGITNQEKITEKSQDVQRKQFVDSVDSISGYYIGEKEITTAEEFYDTAETDIIYEIIRAMESQSKLSEGQVKNSEPPSATSERAAPSAAKAAVTPTDTNEIVPTVTVLKEA